MSVGNYLTIVKRGKKNQAKDNDEKIGNEVKKNERWEIRKKKRKIKLRRIV